MEEKQLNEKESIELISRMIQNTQNKLTGDEGSPFLIWGYATVITTIAVYIALALTQNPYFNFLWFAIPIFGLPIQLILNKKQDKGVTTFVDRTIGMVWLVLGTVGFLVGALCIFSVINTNIPFIILILMGSGTAITGLIIKFNACAIGGFIGIAAGFASMFFNKYMLIIFAVAFILMMIIPGHILNHKSKSNV
jgi:hypothetical protein